MGGGKGRGWEREEEGWEGEGKGGRGERGGGMRGCKEGVKE